MNSWRKWLKLNRRGLALASAAILAVSGVVWAAAALGSQDSGSDSDQLSPTPTPAVFEGATLIDAGRKAAIARDASLERFIDAVEAEDVEQVLRFFFPWNSIVCDELIYRGVNECECRGVKEGTVFEFFAPDWWEGAGLTREETYEAIAYDLQGRHPRLSLIVERSDGPIVLLFMIDPKPELMFPGGVPAGGSPPIALWFGTTKDAAGSIATYSRVYQGSPPMEFLRYEQYIGRFDFKVLGVSTEFAALEAEFHTKNEEQRRTPPAP
jgi:hypothetical protein